MRALSLQGRVPYRADQVGPLQLELPELAAGLGGGQGRREEPAQGGPSAKAPTAGPAPAPLVDRPQGGGRTSTGAREAGEDGEHFRWRTWQGGLRSSGTYAPATVARSLPGEGLPGLSAQPPAALRKHSPGTLSSAQPRSAGLGGCRAVCPDCAQRQGAPLSGPRAGHGGGRTQPRLRSAGDDARLGAGDEGGRRGYPQALPRALPAAGQPSRRRP
mmetsp:Transcript_16763/g.50550  ORF Transcript_16763/g.50550 Transcript_16763/m.50550 type:complete len:216 (-) Transcript_16763:39-686(-)